ncbi:MAG: hypothetical protein IPL01_06200 [Acidobacteria bacterium]|nr:hypothetical protein [Acidobacteriota bacterium]
MQRTVFSLLTIVPLALVCSAVIVKAPASTAVLKGNVVDNAGAFAPGAVVMLAKVSTGTNRRFTTDTSGPLLFLASPLSDYVTGHIISVAGRSYL